MKKHLFLAFVFTLLFFVEISISYPQQAHTFYVRINAKKGESTWELTGELNFKAAEGGRIYTSAGQVDISPGDEVTIYFNDTSSGNYLKLNADGKLYLSRVPVGLVKINGKVKARNTVIIKVKRKRGIFGKYLGSYLKIDPTAINSTLTLKIKNVYFAKTYLKVDNSRVIWGKDFLGNITLFYLTPTKNQKLEIRLNSMRAQGVAIGIHWITGKFQGERSSSSGIPVSLSTEKQGSIWTLGGSISLKVKNGGKIETKSGTIDVSPSDVVELQFSNISSGDYFKIDKAGNLRVNNFPVNKIYVNGQLKATNTVLTKIRLRIEMDSINSTLTLRVGNERLVKTRLKVGSEYILDNTYFKGYITAVGLRPSSNQNIKLEINMKKRRLDPLATSVAWNIAPMEGTIGEIPQENQTGQTPIPTPIESGKTSAPIGFRQIVLAAFLLVLLSTWKKH